MLLAAMPLIQKPLQFAGRVCLLQRRIHSNFEVRRIEDLEGEAFKHEMAHLRMVERFLPFLPTTYLVIGPPRPKFRAAELEIVDQFGQLGIPWIPCTTAAELR